MNEVLIWTTLVSIALPLITFGFFKLDKISPKMFGISLIVALLIFFLSLSSAVLLWVGNTLGEAHRYILVIAIVTLVHLTSIFYLIIHIQRMQNEMVELWQEIALLRNEIETTDPAEYPRD